MMRAATDLLARLARSCKTRDGQVERAIEISILFWGGH